MYLKNSNKRENSNKHYHRHKTQKNMQKFLVFINNTLHLHQISESKFAHINRKFNQ